MTAITIMAARVLFRTFASGLGKSPQQRSRTDIRACRPLLVFLDAIKLNKQQFWVNDSSNSGLNVLGTEAHANYAGWNPTQNWKPANQPHRKGNRERTRGSEYRTNHIILQKDLHGLSSSSRKLTAALHQVQISFRYFTLGEFRSEQVGGGNRVLHGQIDSDTTNRRHGVRRISDTNQAGTIPTQKSIDGDGEEADLFPVLQFVDPVA
jgi:hypothetical protein